MSLKRHIGTFARVRTGTEEPRGRWGLGDQARPTVLDDGTAAREGILFEVQHKAGIRQQTNICDFAASLPGNLTDATRNYRENYRKIR